MGKIKQAWNAAGKALEDMGAEKKFSEDGSFTMELRGIWPASPFVKVSLDAQSGTRSLEISGAGARGLVEFSEEDGKERFARKRGFRHNPSVRERAKGAKTTVYSPSEIAEAAAFTAASLKEEVLFKKAFRDHAQALDRSLRQWAQTEGFEVPEDAESRIALAGKVGIWPLPKLFARFASEDGVPEEKVREALEFCSGPDVSEETDFVKPFIAWRLMKEGYPEPESLGRSETGRGADTVYYLYPLGRKAEA